MSRSGESPSCEPVTADPKSNGLIDKLVAFAIFAGCMGYLIRATELKFGSFIAPKAGFVPTLTGAAAVFLAAINLYGVLRKSAPPREETQTSIVILFVLTLAGYLVAMPFVGFLASTVGGLFCLLLVSGTSWKQAAPVAIGTAVVLHLALVYLLRIPLP